MNCMPNKAGSTAIFPVNMNKHFFLGYQNHTKLKRLRGHEYVDLLNSIHRRFAEELIDQRAGVRIDKELCDEDLKSKDKITFQILKKYVWTFVVALSIVLWS